MIQTNVVFVVQIIIEVMAIVILLLTITCDTYADSYTIHYANIIPTRCSLLVVAYLSEVITMIVGSDFL